MAGFEIDPLFCKALKLLHSATKDSADQIMHLLEEVIEQKYGGTKSLNLKYGSLISEEPTKTLEVTKSSKASRGSSPVQSTSTSQNNEKSSRESSSPSEPVSSRTSPDLDDGDLALEIFEDDLNCKVCKGMSVGARNRLVECSDCHFLYHQECHKPPISEADVNDPRLVWYCSDCMKKNQEKVQAKVKPSVQEPPPKKFKSDSHEKEKNQMFKRSDKSASSSNHSKSSSSSGTGLAHMAATIQGSKSSSTSSSSSSSSSKHHTSSSSSSSSSNSKSSTSLNYSKNPGSPNPKTQSGSTAPRPNIISADKRLQNMKKKAAAKFQEKRTKHK